MKANIPRAYRALPPADKRKIEQIAEDAYNKDVMIILDIYLKMSCAVLHDAFGFGEKRLNCYLGNYRRLFGKHAKLVRKGEQLQVLDEQMRRIFKKSGYPDEFFKGMFEDWSVRTGNECDT